MKTKLLYILALLSIGTTGVWAVNPTGSVTAYQGVYHAIRVEGTATDADVPGQSIYVDVYVKQSGATIKAVRLQCRASDGHFAGYVTDLAAGTYSVEVYALNNVPTETNPQIGTQSVTVLDNTSTQPAGNIESVTGENGSLHLCGWAYDPDSPDWSDMAIYVYVDGVTTSPAPRANVLRTDVNEARGLTGNHGFNTYIPVAAGTHTIEIYFQNDSGSDNPKVYNQSITVSNPFSVTYNANGGSVSVALQDKRTGIDLALSDGTGLTRDGYAFMGWNTLSDGNGTAYAAGDTYTANAALSLYAQWQAILVTSIELGKTSTEIALGSTEPLTATVLPAEALNKSVTWTTSNSAVATVADGIVTPVAAGTCTITATTEDGGFTATCTVTVTDPGALTKTDDNEWTLSAMPAYDIVMSAEYYTDLNDGDVIDYTDVSGEDLTSGHHDIWLARTLVAGSYNTFASPVAISADQLSALGFTAVKELDSSELDGNTLTLNFADATSIEAGKPYLVKVDANVEVGAFDLVELTTTGTVTVTDYVNLVPTLGVTEVTGEKEDILFLGAENKLYNPNDEGLSMKGFRAYFHLHDAPMNAKLRSIRIDFGDGEQTTGILSVDGEAPATDGEAIYDLQGRRLNRQPAAKGVYIVNGMKVAK